MTLRAKRLTALRARLHAGNMLLNLQVTTCSCRLASSALPSAIVNPTLAGEISSPHSITPTSCSTGLPGIASNTSLIVHFIPKD